MKLTKESIFLIFYFFILLLPFVAFQWKFDGYEFPKYFFLIIFGIVGLVSIWKLDKIKFPHQAVTFFLISFLVSTIFSSSILYSFYGDYPRLNHNFLVIFSIFLIALMFRNWIKNQDIFKIVFYQAIFLNLITFFENNQRVISTLGQPNFLGIILVLGIIYSIESSLKNKLFLVSTLFLLIGLFKTASITSIVCLIIFMIYLLIVEGRKYWKYFLLFVTTFIILIFLSPLTREKIIDNLNLITNHHETKITDSFLVRLAIWKDSLKIFNNDYKNLLVGTGPETFSLHYEKYRTSEINLTSEWNSLIDKPHNYFLEILIEQGLLGIISLLILLFYFFQSQSLNKKYIAIIIIFLFFNWAHIYLQLIFLLTIFADLNPKYEIEIKNNNYLKSIMFIYLLILIISIKLFTFEELDVEKNYYQSNNPQVKIEGLTYYFHQKELTNYTNHLKNNYPNNLKIWFEIYKFEKVSNSQEKVNTKEKIKEMRPDLVKWHEVFLEN